MSRAVPVRGEQDRGHRHHAHAHDLGQDADGRWLAAAGALIVAFMAGEVVAGVLAHSLALVSDAAHMLTDAASIGLALVATKLAARPPRGGYTYGLRRLEILSAQANGITLVLLGVWLGYEAVRRLIAAWREGATVAVAAYDGKPRNPVLIGREHWDSVLELADGDTGARPFLRAHPELVRLVECGDTGSAYDVDTPEDLARVTGVSTLRSDENSLGPTGR